MIKLWSMKTFKEIASLKGHEGQVLDISLSEDDALLASGDENGVIKIWDVKSQKEVKGKDIL